MSEVKEIQAPSLEKRGFFSGIGFAAQSLWKGMKVTFGYFSRPSTVITQQYPENRETLKMFDRFRARLAMVHDENGYHKCTACQICAQACPNGSINVVGRKGPITGKTEIDHFVWRMDSCTFCNQCVVVCPFSCLKMEGDFEASVFDRRLLVFSLNRYAGPTSTVLMKIAEPEERKKLIEPRQAYVGPMPMGGVSIGGLPAGSLEKKG